MDISNKEEFKRFTFMSTMERNAAKDNSQSRISKGRPFLMAIDKLKANRRVSRAKQEVNNYD